MAHTRQVPAEFLTWRSAGPCCHYNQSKEHAMEGEQEGDPGEIFFDSYLNKLRLKTIIYG
ncbi:MAG: hypothetical protein L7F78_13070 [Syntrophales bacterium LBB04]|nr:hypothetical protein [Syntrophales bacterium LBB04]